MLLLVVFGRWCIFLWFEEGILFFFLVQFCWFSHCLHTFIISFLISLHVPLSLITMLFLSCFQVVFSLVLLAPRLFSLFSSCSHDVTLLFVVFSCFRFRYCLCIIILSSCSFILSFVAVSDVYHPALMLFSC